MLKAICAIFFLTTYTSITAYYVLDELPNSLNTPLPYALQTQLPASTQSIPYYMNFAGASYCEQSPTYDQFNCPWCDPLKTDGYQFHATVIGYIADTLALITKNPSRNEVVVAFRGTLNLPNVLLDTAVPKIVITPTISVHAGYWTAANSLYPGIVSNLQTLAGQNYSKLIITGHSLGASIASIILFRLYFNNTLPSQFTAVELYTYGQPRSGNQGFADYINNLNVVASRIVNQKDIIPHYIPVALNYYHIATEYWIKTASPFVASYANRSIYEDPNLSNSITLPLTTANILDHATYFNINVLTCAFQDPLSFVAQFLVNNPGYLLVG